MGIKYASQVSVGRSVALSHTSLKLDYEQLLAIVSASIFSAGDCTLEWAVSRGKTLIQLARDNASQ